MNKRFKITAAAKVELEQELERLKATRGEIAEKISQARDFGDLSENAEYDAARNEQGISETRITEIESILKNADILKTSKKGKVDIGSTVALKNDRKTVEYMLVDPIEANPLERKISPQSPLGKELLGKKVGETVEITTPKATTKYKIAKIA
ncbi:MAG: transcription elongation factor GreA [Candidatus Nomurabacteria bacterium]|jgi:transcription elongation factor GreA|nr:transcription elongation factor GreA [Candidatus Nomurabacteria bacterium]